MTADADKVNVPSRRGDSAGLRAKAYLVKLVRARWEWRTADLSFIGIALCGLAGLFIAIVLIDPYDSGRLPSLLGLGVSDGDPRTANISRGRDQGFNAGIFGNSRAMLLSPARLLQITGFRFVQLTTPTSGAREQATLLRYFARRHDDVGAVVMMLDPRWCSRDPNISPQVPFPFELYGDNLHYFSSLLNTRVVAMAYRRVLLALGKLPATDRSGYLDFEADRYWPFHPTYPARAAVDLMPAPLAKPPFPALDHMEKALSELPQRTAVVLFWPPFYYTELPEAGTAQAREIAGCKYQLTQRAALHRNWRIVDLLLDSPASRDPSNFLDAGHFRQSIAQQIEGSIARMLVEIGQPDRL
jgi:hypothetical protein